VNAYKGIPAPKSKTPAQLSNNGEDRASHAVPDCITTQEMGEKFKEMSERNMAQLRQAATELRALAAIERKSIDDNNKKIIEIHKRMADRNKEYERRLRESHGD
jgi:hypothetical protein